MNLISFDIFRTLGLPDVQILKPDDFLRHRETLKQADWVLFPEYWQLNTLIHGFGCRIFPSVATYRIGHDKVEMTRVFQAVAPGHTPWTLIAPNTEPERERLWRTLPQPFVAKLPKASMGEGVWLIETREQWQQYCERTPVLYGQEYLPIDRDLRIVVIGDRILTAYWRHQSAAGFHNNVARGGQIAHGPIPESARRLVLDLARRLDINHAGFDIAMVDGHPFVLEFNRLFGNQGLEKGTELKDAIFSYLQNQSPPRDPNAPLSPQPPLRTAS